MDTLWVKNFVEIALSSKVEKVEVNLQRYPVGQKFRQNLYLARFSRYKHFCVLQFLRKTQNGRHFWRDKNFWKNVLVHLQRYPVGQKFCQNRSIAQSFRDTGIFVFSLCGKFVLGHFSTNQCQNLMISRF